ncbi:hypothetical protein ACN38_g3819 [Penicillium nordicum]|uniref:Uncharacterized protein n=1 Tax=Penicillium nordicum TaxID=229535 RepID=A0A0M8P7P7_9EURO|nr:hypothetical protein ACN38_g3819 [Penicillium nordicum]
MLSQTKPFLDPVLARSLPGVKLLLFDGSHGKVCHYTEIIDPPAKGKVDIGVGTFIHDCGLVRVGLWALWASAEV